MSHHINYNIIFFEYLIDRDHINLNLNYYKLFISFNPLLHLTISTNNKESP